MNNIPKIMSSANYADLKNTFRKKIINLLDELVVEIDEEKDLTEIKIRANKIIQEYYETAESLAQYGTGLKKTQFLEASEEDIEDLKELINK